MFSCYSLIQLFTDIQTALSWLCAYQLELTGKRLASLKSTGKSSFEARNEIQIFYAKTLSILFAQVISSQLQILLSVEFEIKFNYFFFQIEECF